MRWALRANCSQRRRTCELPSRELVRCSPTLKPTGRSRQSCVHPLTLRFKHSFTLQFLSSDWSPQSSLPSHRLPSEMQRPFEHMKKEPLHKLPEKEEEDMAVTGTTLQFGGTL